MEWQVTWLIIIIISLFLSSLVEGSHSTYHDHESLEALICNNVNKAIKKPFRTGVFHNISLPSNYTGLEVTVVRFRTVSLWVRGVNHSFLNVPPHVMPRPNRIRIAIVYQNFGSLSSHYYNVPNYTMVTPVVGFKVYTSSQNAFIDSERLNILIQGNPIRIQFPDIGSHEENNVTICAKFSANRGVEFYNMTEPYVCEAKSPGHYTLVVPSPRKSHIKSERKRFNKWRVLGFFIVFVGLVVLVLVLVALVKAVKRRRLRIMERNAEGGESFDTFWIGASKLPLAAVVRTQPVLEND